GKWIPRIVLTSPYLDGSLGQGHLCRPGAFQSKRHGRWNSGKNANSAHRRSNPEDDEKQQQALWRFGHCQSNERVCPVSFFSFPFPLRIVDFSSPALCTAIAARGLLRVQTSDLVAAGAHHE